MKSHAFAVSLIVLASVAGAQTPAAAPAKAKTPVHHASRTASHAMRSSGGMHMKVVSEDPETGAFTAIVSVPNGYRFKPSSTPRDRWIKVMKGSINGAEGDKWDAAAMKAQRPMVAGDTTTLVGGKNYYAVAKGATQFIVCSSGRNTYTYANPADDPMHGRTASR